VGGILFMITKNIVKQQKSLVEVTVSVPWADCQPFWDQTVAKISADTEIAGFRKGTAPAEMVESQYLGRVQEEFLKTIEPQFLIEALKDSDITPIDYPKYQLVSFNKGADLQYKAQVTNKPAVAVGDYKTIRANKPTSKQVPEEEVGKVIEDLFKRWQSRASVPAQPAPTQSEPAAAPVDPNAPNSAGSISFNANQPAPAAQPAPVSSMPDDDFAKAMGANSLEELKAKIRKDLEDHANLNLELDFEEAILQEVEKMTTVELPDILIEDELNRMLVSLQRRVADMGLLLDDYLKGQKKTLEQIKSEWRPQAEKNVRMELGLSEIARMENVAVSDAELQAEIDKIQDAKVKQQFEAQEPRLHLRHALRQTRTLNLLKGLVAPTGPQGV
jgi:trigger factor